MAHTKNYSQHRTNFALYFSLQFRTAAFCLCNVPHTHTHQHNNTHTPRTHTHRVAWAIFTHYITHLPYNFAAFLWRQSITAATQAMSIDRDLSHRQTHKHTHTHVMACVTWTCVHNYNVCMSAWLSMSVCVCVYEYFFQERSINCRNGRVGGGWGRGRSAAAGAATDGEGNRVYRGKGGRVVPAELRLRQLSLVEKHQTTKMIKWHRVANLLLYLQPITITRSRQLAFRLATFHFFASGAAVRSTAHSLSLSLPL